MIKNIKIGFLLLTSAVLVIAGCDKHETMGNSICPSGTFKVRTPLTTSGTTVNMQTNKLNLKAGFTEDVDWKLKITGKTSGALKTYIGRSDSLNIDWYGNAETDVFFVAEDVDVELSFDCLKDLTAKKTVTLSNKPTMQAADFGTLFNNFDGQGFYSITAGWGDAVKYELRLLDTAMTTGASPQGGTAKLYSGKVRDGVTKTWYYGGFSVNIAAQVDAFIAASGVTKLEDVYLNMYIKGFKTECPNTQLNMNFTANGVKNYNLNVDWDGWKMVTIKASEFLNLIAFNDFNDVTELGFGLGAGPEQNLQSKVIIDFMILTAYKPYKEIQKRNY